MIFVPLKTILDNQNKIKAQINKQKENTAQFPNILKTVFPNNFQSIDKWLPKKKKKVNKICSLYD